MTTPLRTAMTLVVAFAVLVSVFAVPVAASDGEARTVLATPGPSDDHEARGAADVTGEIILGEDRDHVEPGVSGTITIVVDLPDQAAEAASPDGRKIVREVGKK